MVIDIICDGCGTACTAGADLLGQAVECPVCRQVFTAHDSALALGRPTKHAPSDDAVPASLPSKFEVYDPRPARPPPQPTGPLAAAPLAWADQCGIGRAAGAAIVAACVLCVFGIVSPVPVRVAMLALPVWAVGYLCVGLLSHGAPVRAPVAWDGWNNRPRRSRRARDDGATAVARAGLIAGAGGAAALWGLMVHGRSVFDLMAPTAQSLLPPVVAADDLVPTTPIAPATSHPWSTAAIAGTPVAAPPVLPSVTASATVPTPVPSFTPSPAVPPIPVSSAVPVESPSDAPATNADAERSANEDVTVVNLRAIHRALSEHGWAGGRYPAKLAELSQTPGMRAVLRSPFAAVGDAAPGPDAGYTLAAAGRPTHRSGTADLAEVYDAAELADRGVTVGITPAGRLVYLDAEQVAAQRVKWASE